jgi:hypothetical protein
MYDEYYIKRKYNKKIHHRTKYRTSILNDINSARLDVFVADSFLILSGRGFKCGSQLMA